MAEKPRRQVGQVSGRAWLVAVVLAGCFGVVIGWSARIATADHRYVRALAERHEAEKRYFDTKFDQIISSNERTNTNGKKKN